MTSISASKEDNKDNFEIKTLKVPFQVKNMDNEDPDFFFFEGYASTFGNVDLGGDVIERGAFTKTLQERKFKILWQHYMSEPIGMPIEAFEDEKGLFIKAKLPKADDFVRGRVIPQMKIGSIDSMSIGFLSNDVSYKEEIRMIKSLDLFEVSLVTTPMNPKAEVINLKSEQLLNDKEIKKVQDIDCMKDIENILKIRCSFSQAERKMFISKIKDFSKQRDVVDSIKQTRDEILASELLSSLTKFTNELKGL